MKLAAAMTLLCLLAYAAGSPAQTTSENTPQACKDGVDNDGDGFTDCDDQDCGALVFCQEQPEEPPPEETPTAPAQENTPQACQDGADNDGDGFADCEDQDCSMFVFCQEEGTAGGTGTTAATTTTTTTPPPPSEPAPSPEPEPAPAPVPPSRGVPGWALAGSIVGFAMTAPILALGLASEIIAYPGCPEIPSLPLGATAFVLHVAAAPIAFAGGKSTRRATGVRGLLPLRIIGWIAYGLTAVDGFALIGIGAAGDPPVPEGLIGSVVALSLITTVAMSADSLLIWKQARNQQAYASDEKDRRKVSFVPLVSPVVTERRMTGMTLGMGMSF